MRTSGLLKIPPINADLIPPVDPLTGEPAKATGETWRAADGTPHIVYRMSFPDLEATKDPSNRVAVPNPETGKQLVREGYEGPYRVWAKPTIFKEEDFILERAPSGEVRINRGFRPTEEEQLHEQQQRLVSEYESVLVREAIKRGISPADLVSRLLGDTPASEVPAPLEAPTDVEVLPVEGAPGWWNVYVDGQKVSEKNLREGAARELAETFDVSAAATTDPGEVY